MSNVDKYRDEISTVVLAAQVAGHKTTESRIRDLLERALAEQAEKLSDAIGLAAAAVQNAHKYPFEFGVFTGLEKARDMVLPYTHEGIARTYGQTEGS